jgi:hypothetical protein
MTFIQEGNYMKMKLIHPLWTHIPAIAALITLLVYIVKAGPFPAEVPLHFGADGVADNYGSPWLAFGITIGLSIGYILLSVFLDELWARQESAKTFNWLSLLDDAVVGMMAGVEFGYLAFLQSEADIFYFPWFYLVLAGGLTILFAVVLELIRPFHPQPKHLGVQDTGTLDKELALKLKDNAAFVYWESQNPLYITLLTTIIPVIMFAVAFSSGYSQPWVSIIVLVVGILLILPYGGQRTLVTRNEIGVRFGILGFKVLRLRLQDITAIELHDFSPLKDFGGYGIRFNGDMKAYFQRGTRGVKLTTDSGKKYLVGSDRPEHLFTVIKAVTETGN